MLAAAAAVGHGSMEAIEHCISPPV